MRLAKDKLSRRCTYLFLYFADRLITCVTLKKKVVHEFQQENGVAGECWVTSAVVDDSADERQRHNSLALTGKNYIIVD